MQNLYVGYTLYKYFSINIYKLVKIKKWEIYYCYCCGCGCVFNDNIDYRNYLY